MRPQLQTGQRQHAILSPRLQQAVRLLQMSTLDFAQSIADTLDRNPFLEGEEGDEAPLPPPLALLAQGEEPSAAPNDGVSADGASVIEGGAEAGESRQRGGDGEASALEFMPAPSCLNSHLHGQLNVLPLEPRDMALAKALVECLDDDGYLRLDPHELWAATDLDPPPDDDEVRIALRRVQALDPSGVGARDVRECLLLQIGIDDLDGPRRLARRIIEQHLRLLAVHDGDALSRATGATRAAVDEASAVIRRLDPRPGWRFGTVRTPYVTPDAVVRRHRGRWTALLNPAAVPRVRLSRPTVDLFHRHGSGCTAMAGQLQEARWTLRNVEQRFSTIVAVAQAIIDRQHQFLEYGEMAMKPLGLREIAQQVGVHESTVSRVTHGKYIATPMGLYEMKRFFSRVIVMPSGASCSGTAIRGLVRELLESECTEDPLSDARLEELLLAQGFKVSRRTVTKYRQSLHIESVSRRRCRA